MEYLSCIRFTRYHSLGQSANSISSTSRDFYREGRSGNLGCFCPSTEPGESSCCMIYRNAVAFRLTSVGKLYDVEKCINKNDGRRREIIQLPGGCRKCVL